MKSPFSKGGQRSKVGIPETPISGSAWDTDPAAFIALYSGSVLAGGGTIFSYDRQFGFMGLFIVRPEWRGAGLGAQLWTHRLGLLRSRLDARAAIGMDGVLPMVPFYERGGFVFAHRDLRFEGIANGAADPRAQRIDESLFDAIDRFDRIHFPAPRRSFLRRWVFQLGAHAVAMLEDDQVVGYGVVRPARTGFKIGPVFANRPDIAEQDSSAA